MALYYPEDKVVASHYVRKAIPLMVKNDIAPNPCNYALWYSYVSNRDKALKTLLDNTVKENGTCPEAISKKLFEEFVIKEETEHQKHLYDSLQDLVGDIADGTANTLEETTCYARNLEAGLKVLEEDGNHSHIEETVKSLIEATRQEQSIVATFEQQMQAAELEIQSLREQLKEREKESTTDALTKISNRRAFDEHLYQLMQENNDFSLILVDLDHFKQLNDTYGHLLGDKVLQAMGTLLSQVCTEDIFAARYGGEEFAILFKGPNDDAMMLAENVRQLMQKISVKKANSTEITGNITASFGVAQRIEGEYPEQIIERADRGLYQAKESGRNRVVKAA